jgi:hypothetical protein
MRANHCKRLLTVLWLSISFFSWVANAEFQQGDQGQGQAVDPNSQQQMQQQQQQQPQAQVQLRSLAVLPSIDQSGIFGTSLQYALGSLFQQMPESFAVQLSAYNLPAFTPEEIAKAHQLVNAEILVMVYLEHGAGEPQGNLSLYLFDSLHPNDFIVIARNLVGQAGNTDPMNPQYVEYEFKTGYTELINAFTQGLFQPLPGTESQQAVAEEEDGVEKRTEDAKRLFRELTALEEKKYYFGADVGMARFAGTGGADSNVNFGVFAGMRIPERTRVELGVDVFSYALIHMDGRYVLPIAEKFVSLTASLSVGRIMGTGLGNSEFNTSTLDAGQIVVGPGISFDIPLLGTSLRGELKLYFGGGSILFGTYGVSYSI